LLNARGKMKKLPTDIQILKTIYEMYYDDFVSYDKNNNKSRSSKMYVPINIEYISKKFNVDPDLVFGRLYYHLEKKFGYSHEDGTKVPFFTLQAGSDKHCVHFPYLASVLATMKSESKKFFIATIISVVALIVSLISIFLK
jgi:hypothetical protein